MSYHPVHDLWFLARAKLKPHADGSKNTYYGAYLGGFPERARVLIGCSLDESMLHVCGGKARHYPYRRGFGVRDKTMDIDPGVNPDIAGDAEVSIPLLNKGSEWGGILIDPPYSEDDAKHYATGKYPNPHTLVRNAIDALPVGRKVGIIHYIVPRCPKNAKFVACVGVICGFGNRIRVFAVYERES